MAPADTLPYSSLFDKQYKFEIPEKLKFEAVCFFRNLSRSCGCFTRQINVADVNAIMIFLIFERRISAGLNAIFTPPSTSSRS